MRKLYLACLFVVSNYIIIYAQNTNVGSGAGNSGSWNTSIGYYAGDKVTGSYNTFLGGYSGKNTSSGAQNTLIGREAFRTNTTGNYNSVLGSMAGYYSTGSYNVVMGSYSGYGSSSYSGGSFNTLIGTNAGRYNRGSKNVSLGYKAGYYSYGSSNVFIGNEVGYNEQGSNRLYIDNSNTSSPLIWGDFSANTLKFNGSTTTTGTSIFGSSTSNQAVLSGSANRPGLLKIKEQGSDVWSGISVEHTTSSAWSVMGDQDDFGLYDDYNNEWIMLYNENGNLDLYNNGSLKFNTTSSGVSVNGSISTSSHGTSANWKTAYDWGDHANAGYITSINNLSPSFSTVTSTDHIYGRSVNASYSNLYRFGGLYFTWDSDSYGTNTHHSIRSTYGDGYGDNITINSFNHIRFNIDANNNNSMSYFEVGHNTTGTGNILMRLQSDGKLGLGVTNPGYALDVSGDIKLTGNLKRGAHHTGHLEGSYNNIGANNYKSNPIYTIGSNYNPADATLSNMYGVGYTHTNASFINSTDLGINPSGGWGWYAASDGNARVFLNAGNGDGFFRGRVYSEHLNVRNEVVFSGLAASNQTRFVVSDSNGKLFYRLESSFGDNLGNHIATQNLNMNGKAITGLDLGGGGISGNNYNIGGVNELKISDSGEGINFHDKGNMYIVDDETDDKFYIGPGNVGIGLTPSYKLDVDGDIRANSGWIRSTGDYGLYNNSDGTYFYSDNGSYWRMRSDRGLIITNKSNAIKGYLYHDNANSFGLLDGDGHWGLRLSKDNYTSFHINNSEKMRIKSDGNVGIGTTDPGSYKMNVSGPTSTKGLRIPGLYSFGQTSSGIEMEVATDSYNVIRGYNATQNIGAIHFFDDTWASGATASSAGSINIDGTVAVTIGPWNGPSAYFRKSDGFVGIGTTSPDQKLSVIGKINASNDMNETQVAQLWHDGTSGNIGTNEGILKIRKGANAYVSINDLGTATEIDALGKDLVLKRNGASRITMDASGTTIENGINFNGVLQLDNVPQGMENEKILTLASDNKLQYRTVESITPWVIREALDGSHILTCDPDEGMQCSCPEGTVITIEADDLIDIEGNLSIGSQGYIDNDVEIGHNDGGATLDDFLRLQGSFQVNTSDPGYGLMVMDKDMSSSHFTNIFQKNGISYFSNSNTAAPDNGAGENYFMKAGTGNPGEENVVTFSSDVMFEGLASFNDFSTSTIKSQTGLTMAIDADLSGDSSTFRFGKGNPADGTNWDEFLNISSSGIATFSSDYTNPSTKKIVLNGTTGEVITGGNLLVNGEITAIGYNPANWDLAHEQRGSQIAGNVLSWDGTALNLDFNSAEFLVNGSNQLELEEGAGSYFTKKAASEDLEYLSGSIYTLDGNSVDWQATSDLVGLNAANWTTAYNESLSNISLSGLDWNGSSLSVQEGAGSYFTKVGDKLVYDNGKLLINTDVIPPNYTMAVGGDVVVNKLWVRKVGQWFDNVFEEDYDLQSLEEVESYIKENKHLPDVPPESKVKEEGIDLARMNALLLKKIEELTLHMIEIKKESDEQRELITKLMEKEASK